MNAIARLGAAVVMTALLMLAAAFMAAIEVPVPISAAQIAAE